RDPLATSVELVHAWRRFPWVDPALPKHLLPTPWSGTAGADLFTTLHHRLSDQARVQWRELNERVV
ncbi:MAG: PaaX family transcriptional regulator C-terminal domain-containing protein, partial [Jatrophihabitans sp.]